MKDMDCPYCGNGVDNNTDQWEPEATHEMQCPHCEKYFVFTISYIPFYDVEKADCLNGSEHNHQPMTTYPVEFTEMRCTMCGDMRKPTAEEWQQINNPPQGDAGAEE
jgi:hypothetical protein